jgi:hypothetical protein
MAVAQLAAQDRRTRWTANTFEVVRIPDRISLQNMSRITAQIAIR